MTRTISEIVDSFLGDEDVLEAVREWVSDSLYFGISPEHDAKLIKILFFNLQHHQKDDTAIEPAPEQEDEHATMLGVG